MPVKLILNPRADLGRGVTYLQTVQQAAEALGEVDISLTTRVAHAEELAAAAALDGYDMVVACGGDGTVHEVINGLMTADPERRPLLGIIPTGTGNDFAHAMGVAEDVPTAVRNLFGGRTRTADLGLMQDDSGHQEFFSNNLGVGFDANVVIRTAEITKVHGFLKYFTGVLTTLAKDFYPVQLQCAFDQEEIALEVLFIAFGLGPRHGGGFMLTPAAVHGDDLIDSCTVSMLSRPRALSLLNSAIKGTHIYVTDYVTMRQNRNVDIASAEGMPIHIDGEIYARKADGVRRITVTSVPNALKVVV